MQCPSDTVLRTLARGHEPRDVASETWSHVKQCPRCQSAIRRIGLGVTQAAVDLPADALATEPPTSPPGRSGPQAVTDPAAKKALTAQIERGTTVGRYVVLNPIASGSMGAVFAAYDPELDRKVALKLLRTDIPGVDPDEMRSRFVREAQAMARVVHPHVITVYDSGTYGSTAFFAMSFVEGGTLGSWAKEKPRTEAEILEAYLKAGSGLAAAHAAGLVHRDFKPDNVLVSYDGNILVTDFGLVRAQNEPEEGRGVELGAERAPLPSVVTRRPMLDVDLTEAQVLMGTPRYMAPEQMDRLEADARTDQFSFCVALFEALYDLRPFAGATLGEVRKQIEKGEMTLPPQYKRGSPRILEALQRGLSADPAQRFPSMEALLKALGNSRPWWAKRRQLAAVVLAGLSVVALGVGAGMGAASQQGRTCQAEDDVVLAHWNERAQDALRQRWSAEVRRGGPAAALRAQAGLDAYAAQWSKGYVDACEATEVRREQSEDTLALRMACLRERQGEWVALIKLMSAGPAAVPRGSAAPAFLSPVAACGDVVALRELGLVRTDAALDAKISLATQALAEAKALTAAGRPAEALERTDALQAEVKSLGYAPLIAKHAMAAALAAQAARDSKRSNSLLLEAAWATQAAGADRLSALAWNGLALDAIRENRLDEARKSLEQADALARRVGIDDELKAAVLHARGMLSLAKNKPEEAVSWFSQALKLRRDLFGEGHPDTIATVAELGRALLRQGKASDAADALAKTVASQTMLYGSEHPATLAAQLDWADAQWAEGSQRAQAVERIAGLKPPEDDEALRSRLEAWLKAHRR